MSDHTIAGTVFGVIICSILLYGVYQEYSTSKKNHERNIEYARLNIIYHLKVHQDQNEEELLRLKHRLDELETDYLVHYGKPYKGIKRDERWKEPSEISACEIPPTTSIRSVR